ncbi:hypothetical protein JMJ77_0010488 [Colletotrichum scovillei]|uniref:Uncharacterized protein n=1 Tax=Colletotrichum scovillei TaxID=1209932 RepID=A0A9P7QUH4_9PEZI|nr:hypothetical protein JMJ78_0011861 [Colletotrichum scovillei]KAG7042389.1 hypothetical protein JMJ77_0010488 [Colletotrichum scovillei]KAG7062423.1 hypothetical protein JMJ76_0006697 [Colletotrichum scovillei]
MEPPRHIRNGAAREFVLNRTNEPFTATQNIPNLATWQPGNPLNPRLNPARRPLLGSAQLQCPFTAALNSRQRKRKAWMCQRKVFIHHRCGHKITELIEQCETFECPGITHKPVISNRYTCIVRTLPTFASSSYN